MRTKGKGKPKATTQEKKDDEHQKQGTKASRITAILKQDDAPREQRTTHNQGLDVEMGGESSRKEEDCVNTEMPEFSNGYDSQGYKIQDAQRKTQSIDTNLAISLTPNSKSILDYVEKSLAAEDDTRIQAMGGDSSYIKGPPINFKDCTLQDASNIETSMFTTTSRFEDNEPTENIGDCIVSQMTIDVAEPEYENNYMELAEEGDGEDDEENMDPETNPWDQSIFDSMNLEPAQMDAYYQDVETESAHAEEQHRPADISEEDICRVPKNGVPRLGYYEPLKMNVTKAHKRDFTSPTESVARQRPSEAYEASDELPVRPRPPPPRPRRHISPEATLGCKIKSSLHPNPAVRFLASASGAGRFPSRPRPGLG